MTISLKNFILSGNFGPVYIGMPIDELKQHLGEPGDSHDSGAGAGILFYNGFEFYYYTDTGAVHGIQNDNLLYEGPDRKSDGLYYFEDTILVDTWFIEFGKPLSYKQVKENLEREDIFFEECEKDAYNELRFSSGVRLDFGNWKDDDGRQIIDRDEAALNGIRYFIY